MEFSETSYDLDSLLAHYLELLNEYDVFRRRLCNLQSSVQRNLARANFIAARGIRYGELFYDSRMQASRLCCVKINEEGTPAFTVHHSDTSKIMVAGNEYHDEDGCGNGKGERTQGDKNKVKRPSLSNDPIRMFGILSPPPLRWAQADSINMVEDVIPRLIELDSRLFEMEEKIHWARKCRAEVEAKAVLEQLSKE